MEGSLWSDVPALIAIDPWTPHGFNEAQNVARRCERESGFDMGYRFYIAEKSENVSGAWKG